jgi:hypothetical protein
MSASGLQHGRSPKHPEADARLVGSLPIEHCWLPELAAVSQAMVLTTIIAGWPHHVYQAHRKLAIVQSHASLKSLITPTISSENTMDSVKNTTNFDVV